MATTTHKLNDTVSGDSGSGQIEKGEILEVDFGATPERYLVQWASGVRTYKSADDLEASEGAPAAAKPDESNDEDEDDESDEPDDEDDKSE